MRRFKNVKIIDKYLTNNFNLNHIIKKLSLYPDIIKIDVEGEEIQILQNCDIALKNGASFLIEFHTRKILKKFKNNISIINKFYSRIHIFIPRGNTIFSLTKIDRKFLLFVAKRNGLVISI